MTTLVPSLLDRFFFILAGNKNIHNSLDQFEFWQDTVTDYGAWN